MVWQFDNERPIYTQLIQQIERAVVSGEYPPGSKLPPVRELAAEAGVNPNTMQRALTQLESQGLLYTQRTSGRFVTDDEDKIQEMRSSLALEVAVECIASMRALGVTREEIAGFIRQAEEEPE